MTAADEIVDAAYTRWARESRRRVSERYGMGIADYMLACKAAKARYLDGGEIDFSDPHWYVGAANLLTKALKAVRKDPPEEIEDTRAKDGLGRPKGKWHRFQKLISAKSECYGVDPIREYEDIWGA